MSLYHRNSTPLAGRAMHSPIVDRTIRSHSIRSAGAPYSTRPPVEPTFDNTSQDELVEPADGLEGKRPNLAAIGGVLVRSQVHRMAELNHALEHRNECISTVARPACEGSRCGTEPQPMYAVSSSTDALQQRLVPPPNPLCDPVFEKMLKAYTNVVDTEDLDTMQPMSGLTNAGLPSVEAAIDNQPIVSVEAIQKSPPSLLGEELVTSIQVTDIVETHTSVDSINSIDSHTTQILVDILISGQARLRRVPNLLCRCHSVCNMAQECSSMVLPGCEVQNSRNVMCIEPSKILASVNSVIPSLGSSWFPSVEEKHMVLPPQPLVPVISQRPYYYPHTPGVSMPQQMSANVPLVHSQYYPPHLTVSTQAQAQSGVMQSNNWSASSPMPSNVQGQPELDATNMVYMDSLPFYVEPTTSYEGPASSYVDQSSPFLAAQSSYMDLNSPCMPPIHVPSLDVVRSQESLTRQPLGQHHFQAVLKLSDATTPMFYCQFAGCPNPLIRAEVNAIKHHIFDYGHVSAGQHMTSCPWVGCKRNNPRSPMTVEAFPKHVFGLHSNAPAPLCACGSVYESKRKDCVTRHMRDSCTICARCLKDFSTVYDRVVDAGSLRAVAIAARKYHQLVDERCHRKNWDESRLGEKKDLEAILAPYHLKLQALNGGLKL